MTLNYPLKKEVVKKKEAQEEEKDERRGGAETGRKVYGKLTLRLLSLEQT